MLRFMCIIGQSQGFLREMSDKYHRGMNIELEDYFTRAFQHWEALIMRLTKATQIFKLAL